MALSRHSSYRCKQVAKLAVNPIWPDLRYPLRCGTRFRTGRSALRRKRRKEMASALLLIEPCRFAFLHVGLRLFRREELATLELTKSPLDLFGYLVPPLMEPLIFAAQHFQRSPDDLIRIPIGAGLNRLRDRFFVFGA